MTQLGRGPWLGSIVIEGDFPCTCSPFIENSMAGVAIGRDLDESTVAHSDTKINWPIKSDLENDIQVGITMNF